MNELAAPEVYRKVITFYSYKGGTGRSMALANVACILRKQATAASRQREGRIGAVLMIDFDLEAPGLHRYFHDQLAKGRLPSELPKQGVMELFEGFDARTPASLPQDDDDAEQRADKVLSEFDLRSSITELAGLPGLFLMQAGRFDASYSSRVNRFDWEHLYTRSPLLAQKFSEMLSQHFDWVLVDSRTGVTDTAGICTKLIPDTLVVAFTPNRQSLTGIMELTQEASRFRKRSDDLRPLAIFPLPSRIEVSEPERGRMWRHDKMIGYQPCFEQVFRETYGLSECRLEEYFSDVAVPHLAPYAYGEEVAALIETNSPSIALKAYEALATRLRTSRNPWETPEQVDQVTFLRSIAQSSSLKEALSQSRITQEKLSRQKRILMWSISVMLSFAVAIIVSIVTAYRNYSARVLASEAKEQAYLFIVEISKSMSDSGGCAPLNQTEYEAVLRGTTPKATAPVRGYVVGEQGAGSISIEFDDSNARLSAGKIVMVPQMDGNSISWRCSSIGLAKGAVPESCNDALIVYQEPVQCGERRSRAEAINKFAEMALLHDEKVLAASFSPDERRILTVSGKTAHIWEASSGKMRAKMRHDGEVVSAAFSFDGRRIVTVAGNTARLWDAGAETPLATMRHNGPVHSATFSTDGRRIVTASSDNTARLWEAGSDTPLATMQHEGRVTSAVISADGRRIVTASEDKTARLWDSASGKMLATMQHNGPVLSAAFRRDGRRIVTASWDNASRLWETGSETPLATMRHDAQVNSAAFSADGRRIVTASEDKTARLWEAGSETPLATMRHDGWVASASFSTDGLRIVTASSDNTARLWEAGSETPLATMRHNGRVTSATISADGRRILTASEDKTARLWEAGSETPFATE
jgi:WD40 repeat protein/cellulose biosynthesis protein BcsQ